MGYLIGVGILILALGYLYVRYYLVYYKQSKREQAKEYPGYDE